MKKESEKMSDRNNTPDELYCTASQSIGVAHCLALLSLLLGAFMLLSNIMASKIWAFGPITLDGGVILFPLTYVVGDILVELFRKEIANRIATWCCAINVLAFVCFHITDWLPDASGVVNVALSSAFGLSARIMLASTIAFLVSQRTNNKVYDDLRDFTDPDSQMWLRAWFSSLVARFLDTVIFTVIAYFGRQTIGALLWQMTCSFLVGMVLESILVPFTVKISRACAAELARA